MRYFEIFNLKPKFIFEAEDLQNLEENFLSLQKQNSLHEQGIISLQTSLLNEAYEVLRNTSKRFEYLLKNFGIEVEEIRMSPQLVEFIMEIREDIADSETEAEVLSKLKDVEIELEEIKNLAEREVQEAIKGKVNIKVLSDIFSKFKCLSEIIRVHKKHTI